MTERKEIRHVTIDCLFSPYQHDSVDSATYIKAIAVELNLWFGLCMVLKAIKY